MKFGGGKVICDGMGQSHVTRAGGAVDTVITNALIVDHSGICKADVGLKDGRIHKIGKAGNPDTQDGVDIIIGPRTDAIAGEGRILNAGGFDAHPHFICPQQIEDDALHSGITTPGAIDHCLSVADDMDVQVMIYTDTLNESGFVENTLAAIGDRTIHAFHTEGAGGGHVPDIMKVVGMKISFRPPPTPRCPTR